MQTKLTITRDSEGYGDRETRSYIPSSEVVAEWRAGGIVLSIKRGAVLTGQRLSNEEVTAAHLSQDERLTLIAFLQAMPLDD